MHSSIRIKLLRIQQTYINESLRLIIVIKKTINLNIYVNDGQ